MGWFKSVLDEPELRELPLQGRKYSWTSSPNAQAEVTMTKIDRVFAQPLGRSFFLWHTFTLGPPPFRIIALLFYKGTCQRENSKPFRFEAYWLKLLGFQDVVQ
jgi:hypothetical protein